MTIDNSALQVQGSNVSSILGKKKDYSIGGSNITTASSNSYPVSNYYAFWQLIKGPGYFEIQKPVKVEKGADKQIIQPFNPDEPFATLDKDGKPFPHTFVAVRGIPVRSTDTGFSLSSYNQKVPDEILNHCSTYMVEMTTPEGVFKKFRSNPAAPFAYGPSGYQSPEDKAAGNPPPYNKELSEYGLLTYGKNNDAFLAYVVEQNKAIAQDPEYDYPLNDSWKTFTLDKASRSCAECVLNGWNSVTLPDPKDAQKSNTNTCTGQTELLFLITAVASKTSKGVEWRDIEDLDTQIDAPIIAVLRLTKDDRKQLTLRPSTKSYELFIDLGNNKANKHIPTTVKTVKSYIGHCYNTYPDLCGPFELEGVLEEVVPVPTEIWLGRYDSKGAAAYAPLMTESCSKAEVPVLGNNLVDYAIRLQTSIVQAASGGGVSADSFSFGANSEPKVVYQVEAPPVLEKKEEEEEKEECEVVDVDASEVDEIPADVLAAGAKVIRKKSISF